MSKHWNDSWPEQQQEHEHTDDNSDPSNDQEFDEPPGRARPSRHRTRCWLRPPIPEHFFHSWHDELRPIRVRLLGPLDGGPIVEPDLESQRNDTQEDEKSPRNPPDGGPETVWHGWAPAKWPVTSMRAERDTRAPRVYPRSRGDGHHKGTSRDGPRLRFCACCFVLTPPASPCYPLRSEERRVGKQVG